jgi:hypothetical protein
MRVVVLRTLGAYCGALVVNFLSHLVQDTLEPTLVLVPPTSSRRTTRASVSQQPSSQHTAPGDAAGAAGDTEPVTPTPKAKVPGGSQAGGSSRSQRGAAAGELHHQAHNRLGYRKQNCTQRTEAL